VNELENNDGWLASKELETLLRWKGGHVLKMGNVANMHPVPTICRRRRGRGEYALWMENNQIELNALRNAPIDMADTSYGCFLAQQKRDVERVYQKMSAKEKVDFKRKMAEID
jgi:hypothetical protein